MLTNGFQMYLFLTFIILKRKLNIIFCIWPKAYEICIVSLIECIWTLTNDFDYCATPHIKLVSSLATSKIVLRWLITISDLNVLLHLPLHNWQKWRLEELVRFSYGYWNPWVRFRSNRFGHWCLHVLQPWFESKVQIQVLVDSAYFKFGTIDVFQKHTYHLCFYFLIWNLD